jgi:hypothetical protein
VAWSRFNVQLYDNTLRSTAGLAARDRLLVAVSVDPEVETNSATCTLSLYRLVTYQDVDCFSGLPTTWQPARAFTSQSHRATQSTARLERPGRLTA